MNILYFAPIPLYPKGHGNRATVHQYISRLRDAGHKVHYLLLNEENLPFRNFYIAQQYVDTLDVISQKAPRTRNETGYYEFDSWFFPELGSLVAELCLRYKIDCIICTYVMYSKIFDFIGEKSNILKIIDTHDKMTDRHLFLRDNGIKDEFFSCSQTDEASYLKRADVIWARNQTETDYFNQITNDNKAITVSHFDHPNYLNKSIKKIKRFGFLASDNNVNATLTSNFIKCFVEKYSQSPIDIELIIGGNICKLLENQPQIQEILSKYPVKFTGFYAEAADFYKNVDLVVCPIVFGTGINVKMIEAMSFGMPVLTTECGIKGVVSKSSYHHYPSSQELLDGVWKIYRNENKIKELVETSKSIFNQFYNDNAKRFDTCFLGRKQVKNKKNSCSGCGICAGICPSNALIMKLNAKGFYRPNLDLNCSNCGLCNTICPFENIPSQPLNNNNDPVFGSYHRVFATYSADNEIRKDSSTGGFIRTFLSYYAKQFDGVIVLTETNDPLKPEVKLLHSSNDILNSITKSIYFHVELSEAVKILKKKKGSFIVVGTPCQIAGIKNVNKILKRDLFTIELFCGALYSHNLMRKYFELKKINPTKIDFRDKHSGWHGFSLKLVSNSNDVIRTSCNDDEFYFAQRHKFCTQETCLKCKYCYQGTADIQVGDFWGEKYLHNDKGTNLIISRSIRASELIENCSSLISEICTIDDVYKSQPWFILADNRIKKYTKNIICKDLPEHEQLDEKLKLNDIMHDYISKSKDINHLRDVYITHLNKIKNKKDNRSGFLLLPSDESSLLSFGDQAMNATLLSKIHEKCPNTKIAYFAQFHIPNFYNLLEDYGYAIPVFYPSYGSKSFVKRFEKLTNDYKTLVVIGADILDGGCGREQAMNYYNIMKSALMSGMEVITMGMSFNDKNYPEITSMISALSHMGLKINVRDEVSFKRLKSYGCINLTQVADMAFLFDESKYKISQFADNLKSQISQYKLSGKKILGLHITATKENIELITDKISKSLEKYANEVLLLMPHDYRCYDSIVSDKQTIDILYQKLSDKGLNVINGYDLKNEIDVKSVVELCDLLVTCRMHIAIAALSKGVPVISFVYQGKFEGLYKFYDFKHNLMFEKDSFETKDLITAIDYCLSNDLKEMIMNSNEKVFKLSSLNFNFLNNENQHTQEIKLMQKKISVLLIAKKYIYRLLKNIPCGNFSKKYNEKYKKIKCLLEVEKTKE